MQVIMMGNPNGRGSLLIHKKKNYIKSSGNASKMRRINGDSDVTGTFGKSRGVGGPREVTSNA